jgi:hypothetical protein
MVYLVVELSHLGRGEALIKMKITYLHYGPIQEKRGNLPEVSRWIDGTAYGQCDYYYFIKLNQTIVQYFLLGCLTFDSGCENLVV